MVVIHDLSTLAPEPVLVRIGNGDEIEEIDLTIVPARATLQLSEDVQRYGGLDKIPDEDMVFAISKICKVSNPKITSEWLNTKLTRPQLIGLTHVVVMQAFKRWGDRPGKDEEEETEKNP